MRNNPTPAENRMWGLLTQDKILKRFRFLRQKPIDQYIVDFYCSKLTLAIEVDGPTHLGDEAERYDQTRSEKLGQHGIRVIRFKNEEVLNQPEGVRGKLIQLING